MDQEVARRIAQAIYAQAILLHVDDEVIARPVFVDILSNHRIAIRGRQGRRRQRRIGPAQGREVLNDSQLAGFRIELEDAKPLGHLMTSRR